MESTDVRLARIEERQQAHNLRFEEYCETNSQMLCKFIATQERANEAFWNSVGEVKDIKARAKGAWWTLVQMGSLTTVVAGLVAWVVAHWKGGVS